MADPEGRVPRSRSSVKPGLAAGQAAGIKKEQHSNGKASFNIDRYIDYKTQKAVDSARTKLEQVKGDLHAVKEMDFKHVSPEAYRLLRESVEDALLDAYGPSAQGFKIPVDMFLTLPDDSRLKLNVNPTGDKRGFSIVFGKRF